MTKTTTNNMSSSRKSAKALKNLSDILLENTKDAKDAKNIYNSLEKSEIVDMLETQENLNELLLSMGNKFDSWLNKNVDGEWVFTSNSHSDFYIISPEANNIDKWCEDKNDCLSNLKNILNDLFKDKSELRKFIMKLYEKIVKNNKKKLGDEIDNLDKANDSLKKIQSCISDATTTDEMKMCTRQLGGSKSKKRKKSKRRRKSKKRHKKRRKSKKRRKTKKK